MSELTREDFEMGVDRMVTAHPDFESAEHRYNAVLTSLGIVGFSTEELRGMLTVALDRLKQAATTGAVQQ